MEPVVEKILQGVPFAGMGTALERNGLIGVVRNLIKANKYTVDYILNYCESVGYQRNMAEEVFEELTGISPKLIINNNEYYNAPIYVPACTIAWGLAKTKPNVAFYIVPGSYGYSVMEKNETDVPTEVIQTATIPEAVDELKKVAKKIQTLDKIITSKLLEAEDVATIATDPNQIAKPYAAVDPVFELKKNFKNKVIDINGFEREAKRLVAEEKISLEDAEDLLNWEQDIINEDESYANEVLQHNEEWKPLEAEEDISFDKIYEEFKAISSEDEDILGGKDKAEILYKKNKSLFKDCDLLECAERLYQLMLGFSKQEILGHSKVEKKMNKKSHDIETLKQIVKNMKEQDGKNRDQVIIYLQGKVQPEEIDEILNYAGFNKESSKKVKSWNSEEDEYLDSYEYLYSQLENGNITQYKEKVKKLFQEGPSKVMEYMDWLEEHNIDPKEALKVVKNASLKKVESNEENEGDFEDAYHHLLNMLEEMDTLSQLATSTKHNEKEAYIELVKDVAKEFNINYKSLLGEMEMRNPEVVRKIENLTKQRNDEDIKKWINSSKKVTAENITLEDMEEEDNKSETQKEVEKINETPIDELLEDNTPLDFFEKETQDEKVDTINDVVSKCITEFSDKFKDFDKYDIKMLSYKTKILNPYTPNQDEMIADEEVNADAVLQVILEVNNKADESVAKKLLVVFSITKGKMHWSGTVRDEDDNIVAFTEEGLDSIFQEPEEITEDII